MLEKLLCVISVGYVFCPWGVRGCPEPCVCQDKYFNQFADCAYKNFQAVPVGLPSNVTTLSLSANKIKSLLRADFAEVTQVTSLWLAHNEIRKIEKGSLTVLLQLKNLDISHNQIVDFPWEDLYNLTALQLLKMNNNYMVHLSRDAFSTLKELRSLRINSNKFHTIWEGTFDSLSSLSHLQIYSNPFSCTCNLQWLKGWIDQALISIPEQKDIVCSAPEEFKGTPVVELPDMQCIAPLVHLTYQASNEKGELYEGYALTMHCNATGSPVPVIRWKIQTANKEIELNDANVEPERNELLLENRKEVRDRFVVLKNGTLVIPHLTKYEEGAYTCLATNEIGSNRSTLNVAVTASPKREPTYIQERIPSQPGERKPGLKLPKNNAISWAKPGQKGQRISPATARSFPGQGTERNAVFLPPVAKNCSKSQGSHYITNHAFNRSSEMKQHTFDYGIIALEVTETDAKVQLTPFQTAPDKISLEMLYLCAEQGGKAATVVQWSMIESGVNSYRFQGLNPGSNYTLCLTYTGQDCQVQVVFSTRRKIPSLLIMIIVSSFLLGLATIPLVAATCCHLMYKYRGKTYKLIMKTQPPESLHQNAPCTFDPSASFQGSEKIYNPSEVGEESVVAESVPVSQTKANPEEFEACSEYSDRLPLGAEAVNISPEINGNYRQPVR
ncbi:immunoglobulin superfamily containing leucine-rich repeat protein 2 [Callorhinchus milii]|uniref:Immunoglobulin superfamily containing leucine-rich repeat 2 n=1 Tax=Callorhinchus milii TaxID=7868 RepID=A0A4W3HI49_CALMI|nr:immunoglobulin superfamily containing leucine-rich repeat protein 2 [Callorhinchus milii]XP_007906290.1 immunoglobulin superfamily containing leucine-rich repeat protein 2 [Callorhinchus milii]XP_007906291.1 immunoglobulin superfamily containing leucine-rich repeat protein 2 [Callorhinchus milii]|eukprot:gi/632938762/ref/XP_007906282.1/ PREDICTED: immunoglobulin superfamily containing leucine-rich repeat protein 2-like [Callorhinchus milii]